jgi:hypothetical protein
VGAADGLLVQAPLPGRVDSAPIPIGRGPCRVPGPGLHLRLLVVVADIAAGRPRTRQDPSPGLLRVAAGAVVRVDAGTMGMMPGAEARAAAAMTATSAAAAALAENGVGDDLYPGNAIVPELKRS